MANKRIICECTHNFWQAALTRNVGTYAPDGSPSPKSAGYAHGRGQIHTLTTGEIQETAEAKITRILVYTVSTIVFIILALGKAT